MTTRIDNPTDNPVWDTEMQDARVRFSQIRNDIEVGNLEITVTRLINLARFGMAAGHEDWEVDRIIRDLAEANDFNLD